MRRKITLLGAGSGFTQPLFTDILNIEGLDEGTIGLVDIDKARLDVNIKLMTRLLQLMGKSKWKLEASTDRRKVLPGTDYLISTIEVSGVDCVRFDNDIPLKYGIDQCIGDTIGPGGVMKALRTLPVFLEILADARRLCPEALILNYTNPMSIMTLGATSVTDQPFVGLCHSVQGNSREIAGILGIPYEEMEWQCGGINHMAWFTKLRWKGVDMMDQLRAAAYNPSVIEDFPIRTDLIRNLGYFSTEGCGHFSEYVPYYRKRKDLIKLHCRPGYKGGTSHYANNWPKWRKDLDRRRQEMAEGKIPIPTKRGHEYASDIIEAHTFDRKRVIYASVRNSGLIPNLPQTGVVEVATLVDMRGFMPTYFGNLPEQCAALCRSNMAVFDLCARGILNKDRESIIHAMMVDPLSAAVCSLTEIRAMAEELFVAERRFIPSWCQKPKASSARALPGSFLTPFVRSPEVSRILPHSDLAALSYPDRSTLGMKKHSFDDNFLNLHKELGPAGKALVFYSCRIKCQERMELEARLGYDGPAKMWVDGKEVFHDPNGTNPAAVDKAKVAFTVGKGTHEIMVCLDSNGGNAWGIRLRFLRTGVKQSMLAGRITHAILPTILGERALQGIAEVSSMSARNVEAKKPRARRR